MDHHHLPKELPKYFSVSQEELTQLVQENNYASLQQHGGIQGIATALQTHLDKGLCDLDNADHFHRRHQVFGSNFIKFEEKKDNTYNSTTKKCYFVIIDALKDPILVLLLCCAMLSLVVNIKRNGLKEEILDGLIMLIVIFTVFHVSRIINFFKDMMMIITRNHEHHQKLSKKRKAVSTVALLRDGRLQKLSASEVVVGDVVFLEEGDSVPADGLFGRGHRLKLDDHDHDDHPDCFDDHYYKFPSILSGAKVVSGNCYMLVTSVGSNTEASKMMKMLKSDQNKESLSSSNLKTAVDKVNSPLEKISLTISLLALVVQVLRCFIWSSSSTDPKGMQETVWDIVMAKMQGGGPARVNRFVETLCVLVFALRDGLPLGLLVSFHVFKRLMRCNLQVIIRNLPVCGSIGLVTTVCVDKTNEMSLEPTKMVDLYIGMDKVSHESLTGVDVGVLNALREGIFTNTSDSEDDHRLRLWAKQVLGDHHDYRLNKNPIRSLVKGAAETIVPMCTNYFDVHGALQAMDGHKRDHEFKKIVSSLSCVAFASRQVDDEDQDHREEVPLMTLLGFVCLKNPYKPEVKQAINRVYEESSAGGVKIKLILKEDINTARLIATDCGILKPKEDTKEAVVEASVFRNSSEKTRELMVDNIKVLANASPLDKLLVIQCLKEKGEVVAATGMHTLDSPALKEADVGFSMSDKSSEMAKENSDIVLSDNNHLSTVVGVLESGRGLWKNIQKIIQLLLTLQIAAFAMNQIGAALFPSEVPLEPLQLLWFNFVMDVLGALALAGPLIVQVHGAISTLTTKTMWRNILVQVLYQVTFYLAIQLKGKQVLLLHANETAAMNTIAINTFVLCQAFVLINAREIDKLNVFEGMSKDWFLVIVGTIVVLQIATIEIITIVSHGERVMNLKNWCVCIGIAAMSLPIGVVAKCIPWP